MATSTGKPVTGRLVLILAAAAVLFLVPDLCGQAEPEFTLRGLDSTPAPNAEPEPSRVSTGTLVFSPDLLSRFRYSRQNHRWGFLNAVGLDLRKTLTLDQRDIGTLMLQPYGVRRDEALMVPNHVEARDDWELELHQFWFNWTVPARGAASIRVGHFLIPFGLEPFTDTHFTLRQLASGPNLGAKMDWGVSVNGELPQLDYEVALLRGSGMEFLDRGENHAVAGRVATPYDANWSYGLSGFYGQVVDRARTRRYRAGGGASRVGNEIVRRWRVGADLTGIWGPFTWQQEISFGRDFDQNVLNGLADLIWHNREETWRIYGGFIYLGQRATTGAWTRDLRFRTGSWWAMNEDWSVSGELNHALKRYRNRPTDTILSLQLRAHF